MTLYKNITIKGVQTRVAMTKEEEVAFEESRKPNFEKEKLKKIKEASKKASEEIYRLYPEYKQRNIIGKLCGYTEKEFTDMNTFISLIVEQCRSYKENITNSTTLEELNSININYKI